MFDIENIPPKIAPKSVRINMIDTIGTNNKLIMIAINDVWLNAYKDIGKEKICADKIKQSEDAILLGKNLKIFDIGFDRVIIPITTAKESWKPTHKSCIGDSNKIIIAEVESAVNPSYLSPLLNAKSETAVIIVALKEDAEKPQTPLYKNKVAVIKIDLT